MIALIPDKISMSSQVYFYLDKCSSQRLHICLKLEAWELMDLIKHSLAHFWEVDDLTNLLRTHLVEVMPLELGLLFDFASDIIQVHDLSELSQRCHRAP